MIERYIVEQAYKQPLTSLRKFEMFPLDPASSRRNIVEGILSGEIEADALTVIWHTSETEPLRNVTKEIAQEVLNLVEVDGDPDEQPFGRLQDFLEEHFGCNGVAQAAVEAMGV